MTKQFKGYLTDIQRDYYDQAEIEVENNNMQEDVWNSLLEKYNGNISKAKEEYPQARMEQMCKKLNEMAMEDFEKTKIRLKNELEELESDMADKDCIFDQEQDTDEWVLYTPERKVLYFSTFEKLRDYFYSHF